MDEERMKQTAPEGGAASEAKKSPQAVTDGGRKKRKSPGNQDILGICNADHLLLKSFLIALITSVVMFLPSIIWDEGYFLFLGDFNSQQVPFYKLAHAAVRSGNLGWNWYTDLGRILLDRILFICWAVLFSG